MSWAEIKWINNLSRYCRYGNMGKRLFACLLLLQATSVFAQTINRAEYFIDVDPGKGNATAVTVPAPASNVSFNFSVPTTSLANGFHTLSFRIRQNGTGFWSHQQSQSFYIVPPSTAPLATSVTKGEYFFDADPGQGNATAFTVTPGATVSRVLPISTTSLSTGFHVLSIRFRDNLKQWTHAGPQTFYIVQPQPGATNLTRAEYFFDTDPGLKNGIALPIAAGNPQNNNFAIPINSLTAGFHRLGMRYRDNLFKWSVTEIRTFYVIDPAQLPASQIVKAEYFVDTDPGAGAATNIPGILAGANVDQVVALDMTGVPSGTHQLNIRLRDNKGFWSNFVSANFTVLACTPPAAPSVPAASRCGAGTVTLTASGATGTQVYRWYADGVTATVLFTGPSYTSPSLSATTTFFVSVFDPSTLCESTRTSVIATVTIIPKPTLNLAGSLTLCDGNTITLVAPPGFAGYTWSNGLTTQQIVVATQGSYTVTVSDGTCTSSPSDPFDFNILPKPARPIIQTTAGGSLCAGPVTLTAPAGFSNYRWSSGEATSAITVSSPGSFSVVVTNSSGCQSDASDIAEVTTSGPAKPLIAVTGKTNLCAGDAVTLTAPSGFSSYLWSSGQTSAAITVSTAGDYAVMAASGSGCLGVASDTVHVAVFSIPAKPGIQLTGNATLCVGAFILLSAPPGFAFYKWSSGEITEQLAVFTAGNYAVSVGNLATCMSPSSDAVTVNESNQPCGVVVPGNHPPQIKTTTVNTAIEGKLTLNLADLISDADGNLDPSSLQITGPPGSGAIATIDNQMNLLIDYTDVAFSGTESVTIQVCDFAASCTEQQITIEVAGDIHAYNALSPNGDPQNETLYLEYIDVIPETKENLVTIYNRWGNTVFQIANYDNVDRVFKGLDNEGKNLPNGTYYYKIEFNSGKKSKTGFISLRR